MMTQAYVHITPEGARLNGEWVSTSSIGGLYREFVRDYPKFFKMDALCKLGLVAAELLLQGISTAEKEEAAIVLFNRNGSLITDRNYQETIAANNYYPSPALFVYTLPNIVTGEVAIRHKIYGESSFYVLSEPNEALMNEIVEGTWHTSSPSFILTGWVDFTDENDYLAHLKIIK